MIVHMHMIMAQTSSIPTDVFNAVLNAAFNKVR